MSKQEAERLEQIAADIREYASIVRDAGTRNTLRIFAERIERVAR